MIAAPATNWSQSASELGQQADVLRVALDEPVARVRVVRLRSTGPYFEKLSSPTTSWPAASSSSMR